MDVPETRYAKSGEVHIAYQVVGAGPRDVLVIPGAFGDLAGFWEHPLPTRFVRRLVSFSRLILMAQRGTGASDRSERLPSVEQQMDDVLAVLNVVGSERAAIVAISQAGPLGTLLAATYPERVSALVLYGAFARLAQADDYPWGRPPGREERIGRFFVEGWGTGRAMALLAPSMVGDEAFERWWARRESATFTPGGLLAFLQMLYETDVRHVLPSIRVPTLVLHRAGDTYRDPGNSRYMAERIPGARYVELAGSDHFPLAGDVDAVVDAVEEFLTGARHAVEADRVLATILFTDIVGSTQRAADLGDRRWRELLQQHDDLAREEIERFRGREVKATGDGVLATFDGPARAVQCAAEIVQGVRRLDLEVRAGLHTGEVEVAGGDVRGIAVHIGARVAASAAPGEILVSSTVKDLVAGSGIQFEDRGSRQLKGVPGEWRLYAVRD